MSTEFEQLQDQWRQAKDSIRVTPSEELVKQAKSRKKDNLYFHYGNTIILTVVLIMISLFFYYNTPFQDILSWIGVSLMIGGLIIRILLELYSTGRSKRIDYGDPTTETTQNLIRFYEFRKKVHRWPTIIIVGLYTVGFYMLTPEFSRYLSAEAVIIMDISYILGAIFLIWQIRKGLKKEINDLRNMVRIRQELLMQNDQ